MPHAASNIYVMMADGSAVMRGFIADMISAAGVTVGISSPSLTVMLQHFNSETFDDRIPMLVFDADAQYTQDIGTVIQRVFEKSSKSEVIVYTTNPSLSDTLKRDIKYSGFHILLKPEGRGDKNAQVEFYQSIISVMEQSYSAGTPVTKAVAVAGAPATAPSKLSPQEPIQLRKATLSFLPKVLAIGSSTGGPQALQTVLANLKGRTLNLPLVITQHIPKDFSVVLTEQLRNVTGHPCVAPKDGEPLKPGHIYLAPGDHHMLIEKTDAGKVIRLNQEAPENFCRPAVDPMLRSLVESYGSNVLLVILTGMGSDGMLGAKQLVEAGGMVLAQDEATSVVWGMPGAVAKAGLCTEVLPLNEIFGRMTYYAAGGIV